MLNEPFIQFNSNGLIVAAGGNTMKNTMLRKPLKEEVE
jgi:hypothetical protein